MGADGDRARTGAEMEARGAADGADPGSGTDSPVAASRQPGESAGRPRITDARAAERQARADRLAVQLRANLARRKGQARRRAADAGPDREEGPRDHSKAGSDGT